MARKDCAFYHCEHQMGASIDCCTLKKELGNCPCANCEKYVNRNYVFKLGLCELEKRQEQQLEIIRCGECAHFNKENDGEMWCGISNGFGIDENSFCSFAKRRAGG